MQLHLQRMRVLMKKRMKSTIFFFLLFILLGWGFQSCRVRPVHDTVITLRGSDTMVILAQYWADRYMKNNPNVRIEINGGGSSNGIASLLNGTTDIAASSRQLNHNELQLSRESADSYSLFRVALDGIAVIIHPDNTIDSLSIDDLKKIFTGQIDNFSSFGGEKTNIHCYGRINSSGTYEFFQESVLGNEDFNPAVQMLLGNASIADMVAKDKSAIGYVSLGYAVQRDDIKILYLKRSPHSPAIAPAVDSKPNYQVIRNNSYPLSRYLFLITLSQSSNDILEFIHFVQSPEGQQLVNEAGLISVTNGGFLETGNAGGDDLLKMLNPEREYLVYEQR